MIFNTDEGTMCQTKMTQMLMKYIIRYDDTEINLNVKIKE